IDTFTRDTGHRGKIPLSDLLVNYNTTRADVLAEFLRQLEQGARDTAVERQKGSGRNCGVCLAQPGGEQRYQRFVDQWIFRAELPEIGVADEAQNCGTDRYHRSGTW